MFGTFTATVGLSGHEYKQWVVEREIEPFEQRCSNPIYATGSRVDYGAVLEIKDGRIAVSKKSEPLSSFTVLRQFEFTRFMAREMSTYPLRCQSLQKSTVNHKIYVTQSEHPVTGEVCFWLAGFQNKAMHKETATALCNFKQHRLYEKAEMKYDQETKAIYETQAKTKSDYGLAHPIFLNELDAENFVTVSDQPVVINDEKIYSSEYIDIFSERIGIKRPRMDEQCMPPEFIKVETVPPRYMPEDSLQHLAAKCIVANVNYQNIGQLQLSKHTLLPCTRVPKSILSTLGMMSFSRQTKLGLVTQP